MSSRKQCAGHYAARKDAGSDVKCVENEGLAPLASGMPPVARAQSKPADAGGFRGKTRFTRYEDRSCGHRALGFTGKCPHCSFFTFMVHSS